LSSGNKLNFYQFELPTNEQSADDVKRLQQRGLYKLIQSYEHPSAQHIPTFTFHNARANSHIGIVGGSNKEMVVYDANHNMAITTIMEPHVKHVHTVKFYEGYYSQGDPDALNTFLTASRDNLIKLWDLRAGLTPVRQFTGHTNRHIQIGFEISNCYRYLVSGSENLKAYVYDIGSGQVIKSVPVGHEAVTDISFNPVYNEWAASSIDGHARIYRYPAYKTKTSTQRRNPGGGLQIKGQKVKI
jgi:WD40 repeat protein